MQIITNTGAAWLVEDENTYDDSSPNNASDVNFIFANQTAIKALGIGAKIVTLDFDTSTLIHGEEQVGIERAVRPVNNIDNDTRFAALLNTGDDVIRYLIELNKEYVLGDTTGLGDLPTEIDENNILSYGDVHGFGFIDPNPNILWITRHSPADEETTAMSLVFQVRFDESVTGVSRNDFTTSRGTVDSISGSGDTYLVTVDVTSTGIYNLDLRSSHGITDVGDGVALLNRVPIYADESYDVDVRIITSDIPSNTDPELLSIERYEPMEETTSSSQLTYKVIFNKPVDGVDAGDFEATVLNPPLQDIQISEPVTNISNPTSEHVYYVTIDVTIDGTYELDLISAHGITDSHGIGLINTTPTDNDEMYNKITVEFPLDVIPVITPAETWTYSKRTGSLVQTQRTTGTSCGANDSSPYASYVVRMPSTRSSECYGTTYGFSISSVAHRIDNGILSWTGATYGTRTHAGCTAYFSNSGSYSGSYSSVLGLSQIGTTQYCGGANSLNIPSNIIDRMKNISAFYIIMMPDSQTRGGIDYGTIMTPLKITVSEPIPPTPPDAPSIISTVSGDIVTFTRTAGTPGTEPVTHYSLRCADTEMLYSDIETVVGSQSIVSSYNINAGFENTISCQWRDETLTTMSTWSNPTSGTTENVAPTPTYPTDKPIRDNGNVAKIGDEIIAVGSGHYIVDLDYLDDVSNIKFTGTVTDATFNIVRIDEVSENHGEAPRYSSTGMIDYDEMDPNLDGLYMEFILPTSNSEIVVSAHSIVPVSHFFKITDLPDDTPWEIRQDGLPILRGVTDGNELILHEHEFPVINLDGTFEFILYPNSMIWTDDFSTIILDKYHDQEIHIDTTEDRIYIVHAYVNVPITGNITVTNMQLIGRDANITNLPLNYLEGTYNEPIFIPVIPNYKGFSMMLNNVTASMNYKDVLNAPSVQIADPSERTEIVRNYTNPSTYGESTTGTVAYYVATDDSVKMQIVMSIDGSLEIQNNYLGCTVRETDENTPWKIRDPLNAWAEVYVNGEQRSFNGTDRIFLGENEFPSTAQKFFNGTHTLEVIDDVNFNILSNTNLLPLDSSIDVPECTLESFQITSYELEGLEEGKIYKVKMKPRYDGSSNGVWSNEVSIMTMSTGGSAIPPITASANIPSSDHDIRNLTLESNEPGTISVSWTAPVNVPDKDYRLQWAKYIDNYISFTEDNFFEGNAWPAPETFTLVRNTLFEYPTFLIVGAVQVDDLEPGDIVELFVYAQIYGGVDEVYEAPANVDILQETGWAKATVEIISASVSLD